MKQIAALRFGNDVHQKTYFHVDDETVELEQLALNAFAESGGGPWEVQEILEAKLDGMGVEYFLANRKEYSNWNVFTYIDFVTERFNLYIGSIIDGDTYDPVLSRVAPSATSKFQEYMDYYNKVEAD